VRLTRAERRRGDAETRRREALVPIDEEIASLIKEQQQRSLQRWPAGTPVLFPRPNANIDGNRPITGSTYRDALGRWLASCDIRDEYGQPVRLTPHQWRHTLAVMNLLHAGVDIAVLALWLGHESTRSTQAYIHADMKLKEQALARTTPAGIPAGRYTPSDPLLAFLENL
jgi:integrase